MRAAVNNNKLLRSEARTDTTSFLSVFVTLSFLILASILILFPAQDAEAANAGYSEFYIPGDEDDLHFVLS